MRIHITADRIRSILADAMTETDAARALRRHRVRYSFSTEGGALHIRIPSRSGIITVTRTASRSVPLVVAASVPTTPAPYPFPVPAWSWND